MAFPEEGPIVGHNLLQTFVLRVVSGYQEGTFCVLRLSARCWMEEAMSIHPSGFDG